jgi:TonB family protein
MSVSDVLRDRRSEPDGFQRMAAVSITAHMLVVAAVIFAPASWRHTNDPNRVIMTISLGGGVAGPSSGGQTALGGRAVQEVRPPDEKVLREAPHAPAAKTPEMTLPDPKAKLTKTPPKDVKEVKNAPDAAKGHSPIKGDQLRAGTALAETGVRGQGFGLSTGGGTGGGSYLDVQNFCCPDYIQTMNDRIHENWLPQPNFAGQVMIRFTIQRDGRITDMTVERTSGAIGPDLTAQRAITMTKQLPPLPAQFPNPTLTVHLNFVYQ